MRFLCLLCSHSTFPASLLCPSVAGCLVSRDGRYLLDLRSMLFHASHVWGGCCAKSRFFLIVALADVNLDFIPSRKKSFFWTFNCFYSLPAMPCNYYHLRQGRNDGHFLMTDLGVVAGSCGRRPFQLSDIVGLARTECSLKCRWHDTQHPPFAGGFLVNHDYHTLSYHQIKSYQRSPICSSNGSS